MIKFFIDADSEMIRQKFNNGEKSKNDHQNPFAIEFLSRNNKNNFLKSNEDENLNIFINF
jgi:hypothetical protein